MIGQAWLMRQRARRRIGRLGRQDAAAAQAAVLLEMVRTAKATAFGRAHRLAEVRSVADYQAQVPVLRYEDFWARWWRQNFPYAQNGTWPGLAPFLAKSAGIATGTSRTVPVSQGRVAGDWAGLADALAFHLAACPGSRLAGGLILPLGGSVELRRMGPGVRMGDPGGIAAVTMPGWLRQRAWPPRDVALLFDWEEKLDRVARGALGRDIRGVTGTPGSLLALFERLSALHPDHPRTVARIFPKLELVLHGGAGFAPYRQAFDGWLRGTGAETREVYAACEGLIAAADRGPGEGMRLMLDHGLFLEFVPVEDVQAARPGSAAPRRHWIGDAEVGRDYALVVTSNAGLWSMLVGDRVRLVSLDPPRILVAGPLGQELPAGDGVLTVADLDQAVAGAASAAGRPVSEYAVHGFQAADGRGCLLVVVEAGRLDVALFGRALEAALVAAHAGYASGRAAGAQLPALVRPLAAGGFEAWMRKRKRLGGQNKVPRVVPDHAQLADLLGVTPDALRLVFEGAAG